MAFCGTFWQIEQPLLESGQDHGQQRLVQCVKLGRELPGLPRRPYPGDLGKRIYANVSQQAWNMWMDQALLLINHYGLSMLDPRATQLLMEQAESFCFGDGGDTPEGWMPDAPPQG